MRPGKMTVVILLAAVFLVAVAVGLDRMYPDQERKP